MSAEASTVYSLSHETGFGAEVCKIALERSKNDVTHARRLLERWNAGKKTPNSTDDSAPNPHGVVCTYFDKDFDAASVVEVRCTDELYSQSKEFYLLAQEITEEVTMYEEAYTVEPRIPQIEEANKCKITISSGRLVKTNELSLLTTYSHKDNVGVVVETQVDNLEAFNNKQFRLFSFDCALHIAAFDPVAVRAEEIPATLKFDIERQIEKQLMIEGKAMQYWSVAVEGKLNKWAQSRSLLNQIFIKSDKDTVDEVRKKISEKIGSDVRITRFIRFGLGS